MPVEKTQSDFHAGRKLSWLERIARDRSITGTTAKVAIAISERADRDGIARTASQPWIAKCIGISERAVRGCIGRLRKRGYLETMTIGRRTAQGRGRASELRLITPQRSSSTSDFRKAGARNAASGKGEAAFQKPGSAVPPLPSSFPKNLPTVPGSDETDLVPMSKPDCPWPAIKCKLARSERFGQDKVRAWLDRLQVSSVADGVLVLMTPSRFIAQYVAANFERQILEAWQELEPQARQVRVEYVSAPPLSQQGDDYVDL